MVNAITGIQFFFPAHNEVDNLIPLITESLGVFSQLGCPFNLAIVNDGSTDGTHSVAEKLAEQNPDHVQVVHHAINSGYSVALKTGFELGLASSYPWIGFCDADLQFDIGDIKYFVQAAQEDDVDIVVGMRQKRADGWLRLLTGRGWHYLNALVLDTRIKDIDCGFKLFRREVIADLLPQLIGEKATISAEMIARAVSRGYNISEVVVEHRPRLHGKQSGVEFKVILGSFVSLGRVAIDKKARSRALVSKSTSSEVTG